MNSEVFSDALRSSEQQFRLLVESVTDYAIYMLDLSGRVSSWNAGAARIKGYAAAEIIGAHFSRFYTPEDRAAGIPDIGLAAARREGRWEHEGVRVRKDGSRFFAHAVIDAIRAADGTVIGFAKVTRDITERVESQRALDQAREALFQAQKMEAIGQLTGGIAHDFNNLLMAVMGSLELARRRLPDDPKLRQLIDNAMQGAERGASLTRRLLSFARKQELQFDAVDVRALVDGMLDLLQRSAGPGVRLEIDIPDGLPPAHTDANQLETALLNLAVNARDAMADGGRLTISAATGGPGRICLAVADTGEGMDAETAARAVEPFFTTKGVGKGTGLGLSMVQGLAAQSGGEMRIRSAKGAGTTVELWLPVAAHRPQPKAAAPAAAPDARRPGLRIMVVDDDALVLMNTAAMLEDLGHSVREAASGAAALELLAAEPADLVITDQAMPGMTGLQLRERIRTSGSPVPVLVATGYAELPAGAEEIARVSKPFTQDQLAAAVARALAAG